MVPAANNGPIFHFPNDHSNININNNNNNNNNNNDGDDDNDFPFVDVAVNGPFNGAFGLVAPWPKASTADAQSLLPGGIGYQPPSNLSDLIYNNMTLGDAGDNDTNLTCEYEKHEWLAEKFYLISVCGTTVAVLGILGNVTTAMVLTRPAMRTPNNLYLTTLAIFDTCLLITAILLYSVEYIFEFTDNLRLYQTWLSYVPIVYALSHIAQTGSVYVTVAVTIERYIAVVYPERSKIFCTQKGAGSAIFWVLCFAIVFNCTKFFELEVMTVENCTDFAELKLRPSLLQNNDLYMTVYSLWLTQTTMVFAPFLALSVFNTIIALTIRKSFKRLRWAQAGPKRNELKEKSREATYVLIVIVLIFLICNSPGFVLSLMERIYGAEYLSMEMSDFYTFTREAVNFLTIVNSSINFVIYCIFGKDFRKELVHIYCCKGGLSMLIPFEDKFTASRFCLEENVAAGGLMIDRRLSRAYSVLVSRRPRLADVLFGLPTNASNTDERRATYNKTSTAIVNGRESYGSTKTATAFHDRRSTMGSNGYLPSSRHRTTNNEIGNNFNDSTSFNNALDNSSLLDFVQPDRPHRGGRSLSSLSNGGRRSSNGSSTPSVKIFYNEKSVTWL